ncbi:cytoplasmic dynein 2 intermediate chain 2-like [Cylas formicarius]|uniref:cytoplasmic dynein 2 intermediate chain 2-like n=1 Tax=Cylas formicarius TaxID=197179 RepID=UPI002958DB1A|nr:cytoplasmic dynein 2 intermediate chain 2-like [Cylas formicarius]
METYKSADGYYNIKQTEMFGFKHNECVGFESRWKVKKVSSSASAQTTKQEGSEQGCNAVERNNVEIQSEAKETVIKETDMDKLAGWLSRIYPSVRKELDSASKSRAFKRYPPFQTTNRIEPKLVQELEISSKVGEKDKNKNTISCLSWNQTGNLIATSQSANHTAWCYHTGVVSVFQLHRNDRLEETPVRKFETDSCATALDFHPTNSAILAAGTHIGQIYMWDIYNEMETLLTTLDGHDEAITQISWVSDLNKCIVLVSSSTDGLLKLWNFNLPHSKLNLRTRFKIKTPILGKINQTTEVAQNLLGRDLGVVCFDFSTHVPDIFVVAMEGGLIVQCSLLGATPLKGNTKDEPLLDPVYKYYEPHQGEVTRVKFSPDRKEMFLTNGTDGEIRIYLLDQDEPAQIIFVKSSLADVAWIPKEEKFLAGCGYQVPLEVFDIIKGKKVFEGEGGNAGGKILSSVRVNHKNTKHVAVGGNNGRLQLWNVQWQNI